MGNAASIPASAVAGKKHDYDHSAPPKIVAVDCPKELEREPLVLNGRSLHWITDRIANVCEDDMPAWWWPAFIISAGVMGMMFSLLAYLVSTGVGVWGLNNPAAWAWDITNFVFWIGIGHAGTLISAVLFLLRQKWRTSINRSAEAMTLFAVACAGIFPVFHTGRVWFALMPGYLIPMPNFNYIWPQS